VPEAARFCPFCGNAIVVGRTEERRVVSVLFADLVGFTAMAETLDPEQVKHLVDGCFQLVVADIVAYGGRVDKIVGDAVVALFGAPVAHEDDAERAVRAALRGTSRSRCASASTPAKCWWAPCGPVATTRRWATW
jgi:class 3 adenylate cyclase